MSTDDVSPAAVIVCTVHEKVVTDGQTNGQPEIKCLPSLAD